MRFAIVSSSYQRFRFQYQKYYFFRIFQPLDHSGAVDHVAQYDIVGLHEGLQTFGVTERRNTVIQH
jgi:hypothetical protein